MTGRITHLRLIATSLNSMIRWVYVRLDVISIRLNIKRDTWTYKSKAVYNLMTNCILQITQSWKTDKECQYQELQSSGLIFPQSNFNKKFRTYFSYISLVLNMRVIQETSFHVNNKYILSKNSWRSISFRLSSP